jgi:hypothetical protein
VLAEKAPPLWRPQWWVQYVHAVAVLWVVNHDGLRSCFGPRSVLAPYGIVCQWPGSLGWGLAPSPCHTCLSVPWCWLALVHPTVHANAQVGD